MKLKKVLLLTSCSAALIFAAQSFASDSVKSKTYTGGSNFKIYNQSKEIINMSLSGKGSADLHFFDNAGKTRYLESWKAARLGELKAGEVATVTVSNAKKDDICSFKVKGVANQQWVPIDGSIERLGHYGLHCKTYTSTFQGQKIHEVDIVTAS